MQQAQRDARRHRAAGSCHSTPRPSHASLRGRSDASPPTPPGPRLPQLSNHARPRQPGKSFSGTGKPVSVTARRCRLGAAHHAAHAHQSPFAGCLVRIHTTRGPARRRAANAAQPVWPNPASFPPRTHRLSAVCPILHPACHFFQIFGFPCIPHAMSLPWFAEIQTRALSEACCSHRVWTFCYIYHSHGWTCCATSKTGAFGGKFSSRS